MRCYLSRKSKHSSQRHGQTDGLTDEMEYSHKSGEDEDEVLLLLPLLASRLLNEKLNRLKYISLASLVLMKNECSTFQIIQSFNNNVYTYIYIKCMNVNIYECICN